MQKKLEKSKKKKNQMMTELDRQQIDKLVSKHSAAELAAMAEAGRVSLQKRQAQQEKNQGILRKGRLHKDFRAAQNYDLWGAGAADLLGQTGSYNFGRVGFFARDGNLDRRT